MAPDQAHRTAAWAALLRVHAALVPRIDREVREASGLPLAWYDVLLELAAAPAHRLRMSELGERVVLSRTRASRVVDELVRAGLVRREANPADRRSSFTVMTDDGRRRQRAAAPVYLASIERHFTQHLKDHERRTMTTALARVLAADQTLKLR